MTNDTYFVVLRRLDDANLKIDVVPFDDELSYLQNLVGGLIDHCSWFKELNDHFIDIWIDDEGKIKELEPTLIITKDHNVIEYLAGNLVFSKYSADGETYGLTLDEIDRYVKPWIKDTCKLGLIDWKNNRVLKVRSIEWSY